jgi:hypothetical protein
VATKYFANKPIKHGKTHYRPGDEITGFTAWWRYWQLLRYNYVNQVDTAGAPTIDSITPANLSLIVNVTPPAEPDPFSNYEYKLDAGAWTAFSPADAVSPFTITGLTNGTPYAVRVRAVDAAGVGTQSNEVTATPATTPSAPTALIATPGSGQLSIAFTAGSNGGSAITNYEYRIAPSTTFIAFSPVDTTSPVVVTGMTPSVAATVYIRAINAMGNGASASVTGTPTA